MRVKIITNGQIKDHVAIGAKIEHVQIKEDWRAYTTICLSAFLVLFGITLPLILARVIF
jgi:hypothetical protein